MTSPAQMPVRKSAKTEGGNVAEWMAAIGVQPGGWQQITKKQLKVLQRPCWPLKVQLWATGMLHTIAYQGEKAWTMRNNKRAALTLNEIAKELAKEKKAYYAAAGVNEDELIKAASQPGFRWSKQDLRAGMVELELMGIGERWTLDGRTVRSLNSHEACRLSGGKTGARIELFFWANPKNAEKDRVLGEFQAETQQTAQLKFRGAPEEDRGAAAAKTPDTSKPEVGNLSLPSIRILQILNVFEIAPIENTQISSPAYQSLVLSAYEKSRVVFVTCLRAAEVENKSAPQVATEIAPKVGNAGGVFVNLSCKQSVKAGASSSYSQEETTTRLDQSSFHTALCRVFGNRNLGVPTPRQSSAVFVKLNAYSSRFIQWLDVEKLPKGKIRSVGALPELTDEFLGEMALATDEASTMEAVDTREIQAWKDLIASETEEEPVKEECRRLLLAAQARQKDRKTAG